MKCEQCGLPYTEPPQMAYTCDDCGGYVDEEGGRKDREIMDTQENIRLHNLMVIASDLMSEDGENPEYDRALVEIITIAAGYSPADYKEDFADLIDQAPHRAVMSLPERIRK